jgi:hypothetical protein
MAILIWQGKTQGRSGTWFQSSKMVGAKGPAEQRLVHAVGWPLRYEKSYAKPLFAAARAVRAWSNAE